MIRVMIADDHALIREGLRKVFSRESDIDVVVEAGDAREAVKAASASELDVAIIDFNMPGQSGLDAIGHIHRVRPGLPVLMLTMYPEEDFAVRAFKAGAAGFLSKESAAAEIVEAVRRVAAGKRYISPAVADRMADELLRPDAKHPHELLSNREFQVLRLIASGKRTRKIAEELSLSVNTVATYRRRILQKLGVGSDVEITRYALRMNLLD